MLSSYHVILFGFRVLEGLQNTRNLCACKFTREGKMDLQAERLKVKRFSI